MRFRTVLFDLDGTLIEHLPAIHRCYCYTLPKLGYPAPTYEQVKRAIGGGLPRAMAHFVPPERVEEALAIYRPHWDETMLEGVELMPGAEALLRALKARGVSCGVFTNKHGPSARKVCEHLGVAKLLDDVVGAGDTEWLKPEPKFAAWALERIGADAATTCLVGDSPFDVQAAARAGMGFVGVTTGTHDQAQLREAGAEVVLDGMPAILELWGLAENV
ncbi:HAD family hydrolase [Actomonas aquatica]|uniref:phosphoglycolate phosphatase n=1 Tax=Actomonas aquatica TaxID=2866162 RepID=A0ABZ1C306_9BACT|nr:HAD family hydrolase [Opitutus sp. WL0086]WRQ85638.1 HAD family hydrolase [Opitutus sp. WL0086]